MRRPLVRDLLLVLGVGAVVRVLHLALLHGSPFVGSPVLDAAFHDELARRVAAGEWTAGAPWFRAPLYPLVLGLAYRITGGGVWTGPVLGSLLGLLTAGLLVLAGRELAFGRRARIAVGLAWALFAPGLFFETELLGATLATFLATGALTLTLAAWNRPGTGWHPWAGAAAVGMLAGLARAPLALLPLGTIVLALLAGPGRAVRGMATLGAALLVLSPFLVVMQRHGEGLRFPATQGGVNLFVGNHPGADGRSVDLPELGPVGWREFADASRRYAGKETGRNLTAGEASDWWTRRALRAMADDPGGTALRTARRGLLLVHGFESPNNRSLEAAREDDPLLRTLLVPVPGFFFPSGLLLPLGLLGLVVVTRRRSWVPVLLQVALVLVPLTLFFAAARFRLPALPALMLAVVPALQWIAGAPRRRAPVALGLVVLLNLPWPGVVARDPAREAVLRGEAWLNRGETARAEAAYTRALALDPGRGRAALGLAVVAERRGDRAAQGRYLSRAETALSGTWYLEEAFGRYFTQVGDPGRAVDHFRRAVAAFPDAADLHAQLGLALETANRPEEARAALEEAAARGTRDPEAWNSLGRLRRLAGDPTGAREALDAGLRLAPEGFKLLFNRALLRAEAGDRAGALDDLDAAARVAPDEAARSRVAEARSLVLRGAP